MLSFVFIRLSPTKMSFSQVKTKQFHGVHRYLQKGEAKVIQTLVFKVSFCTTGFIKYIITQSHTKNEHLSRRPISNLFSYYINPLLWLALHMSVTQPNRKIPPGQELFYSFGISLEQYPAHCILWVPACLTDYTSTSPVSPGEELVFSTTAVKSIKTN